MVYVFKALEYVLETVLELLNHSVVWLLIIFKLSMRIEQLLDSLNGQCYNEVANGITLPSKKQNKAPKPQQKRPFNSELLEVMILSFSCTCLYSDGSY